MLISDRSKEIIENLMNANGPLTVSALSKKLGVTERTIYRQIPEVTEIIESYDLTLDNSSGNGFMIFGSLYNLKRLNSAFEEVKTLQQRRRRIRRIRRQTLPPNCRHRHGSDRDPTDRTQRTIAVPGRLRRRRPH